MRKELAFEIKRKFVHSLSLLFVIIYLVVESFYDERVALMSLIGILFLFLLIDYFRVVRKCRIPLFHGIWREKEKNKLGGNVFLIIGVIIALAVFDFEIALAALLITAFGDMAAAIVGVGFGKHYLSKKKTKTWEGTIAGLVVNFVIGFFLIDNLPIVFGMAVVAVWVEAKLTNVDDNLAIPVLSGFVGQALKMFL